MDQGSQQHRNYHTGSSGFRNSMHVQGSWGLNEPNHNLGGVPGHAGVGSSDY